jgi:hypothetical protein
MSAWCLLSSSVVRPSSFSFSSYVVPLLSIRIRNLRACWACASGTDACTEHTSQELVRALSIRIR